MVRVINFLIVYLLLVSNSFAQGYSIKTIVLDAGHGGRDSGALGKKSKEKEITLAITLLVGKYLENNIPEVKIVYTRKDDIYLTLPERAKIANDANADLFISLHVNSNTSSAPYGFETYVLGLHRSDDNLKVAMRENSVITYEENYMEKYEDFDPNSPESYITFAFINNKYLEQSTELAYSIQNQFKKRVGVRDRGVSQAGFAMLRETSMPSVLIEMGFISNANEEQYLLNKSNQEFIASGIYRAIKDYKAKIDTKNLKSFKSNDSDKNITNTDTLIVNKSNNTNESMKNNSEVIITTPEVQNSSKMVIYKLQILASKTEIKAGSSQFKGEKDIDSFIENGYFKYTIGSSENLDDILKLRQQLKSKFIDAFPIASSKGEKISVKDGLRIQSEK